jgi:hypothetical protein
LLSLKVFIDTEFTNFFEPRLISLGMVAESHEEFYVEVPFPVNECSDFVREMVVPMLNQYPNSYCPHLELRSRILNWLQIIRMGQQPVEICYDYATDWDLFVIALDYSVPAWVTPRNVDSETSNFLLADFWRRSEENGSEECEHHALSDAKALAYAFRAKPPTSI